MLFYLLKKFLHFGLTPGDQCSSIFLKQINLVSFSRISHQVYHTCEHFDLNPFSDIFRSLVSRSF